MPSRLLENYFYSFSIPFLSLYIFRLLVPFFLFFMPRSVTALIDVRLAESLLPPLVSTEYPVCGTYRGIEEENHEAEMSEKNGRGSMGK